MCSLVQTIQVVLILRVQIQAVHPLTVLPRAQVQVQVLIQAAEVTQAEVINEIKVEKRE